jgi:tetratricopeptide (TPR) repeat protein/tRNA A-37 threonylcarbamoyl transferase component Bud32
MSIAFDGSGPPGPGTDHTLIEGLLAVRMGLIGESAFRRALDAWQADPARPFGEVLRDHGCLGPDAAPVLEAASRILVEHHGGNARLAVEALADASRPTPAAPARLGTTAVESGSAAPTIDLPRTDDAPPPPPVPSSTAPATPDPPAPLRAAPDARTLSHPDRPAADLGFHVAEPPASAVDGPPTFAGRYRLLNLHARGNLGEVFRARDDELGREVALKRIQNRHAEFADRRDQFEVEARITGALEHPGIVPVYSLGRGPDGRPFYTMRLIRGQSLRQAIGDYHTGPGAPDAAARDPVAAKVALRGLVRRLIAVCESLAYAHSRGVLHRDIKPSNIMLGDYGETLLVDWGLAKAHGVVDDPSTVSVEGPLQIGEAPTEASIPGIKGTIPYMSPEQARGEPLDGRSDVYSLGGTLYSLLTGRLPYEGTDTQEILAAVRRGEPRPPRAVRRDVPPALDAICRRAMAPTPATRYPSARALADELTRWIDDEPVLAYPEPWPDRLRRWARKHQAAAGVAAATFAMLALASVPLGLLLRSEAAARAAADESNEQLVAQRQRTERQFRETRELVDDFTDLIGGNIMLLPGGESFRRLVVEEAAQRYDTFLEERPDDPEILAQAAHVFRIAANCNRALEVEPAPNGPTRQLYDRAIDLYRRAAATDPTLAYRPALTLADRAEWHRLEGRLNLAESDHRDALAAADAIPAGSRAELGDRLVRGIAHMDLGGIHLERGELDAARREAAAAVEWFAPFAADPGALWSYRLLALQARRLALEIAAAAAGRLDPEAVEALLAETGRLLEANRGQFDAQFFHGSTLVLRARAAFDVAAEPEEARRAADRLREDSRVLLTLFQGHPSIPYLRRATAETYLRLGEMQVVHGNRNAARQNVGTGLRLARVGTHAEDLALQADALDLLGRIAAASGETETARTYYDESLAAIDSAIAARPNGAALRRSRAETLARKDALDAP